MTPEEAEELFLREPLVVRSDIRHSKPEKRYYALSSRSGGIFLTNVMKKKAIPEFQSEDAERKFWATADSTEYVDWSGGRRAKLVHLKPTLKTISLRLPASMIEDLKILANRKDVPYQSLLKVFLAERIAQERRAG